MLQSCFFGPMNDFQNHIPLNQLPEIVGIRWGNIICQGFLDSEVQFFPLSFILTPFMEQNYFSCKTTGILTIPFLDSLSPSFPCVSFYLCFSFFLLFSILSNTCMAAIFLERSLHHLFCFNIQTLNLNSCFFRHRVRMVRVGVLRYNFFSPLFTPGLPASLQNSSLLCISQAFKCL